MEMKKIPTVTNMLICEDGSTVETYSDGTQRTLTADESTLELDMSATEVLLHLTGHIPPGKSDLVQ